MYKEILAVKLAIPFQVPLDNVFGLIFVFCYTFPTDIY